MSGSITCEFVCHDLTLNQGGRSLFELYNLKRLVMIKSSLEKVKITFSYKKSYGDCLYQDFIAVEYGKPYCMIQIEGRGSILFLISLHDVLEKLPANFLLINRGIIVNIEHVTDLVCLDGVYHVKMDNNKIYRISTRKVAILKRALMVKSDTIQV